MLLSFLKIMALNSISYNFLNCISFISSSVEFSCSFIWDLYLCFIIFAISVGFGACQIYPMVFGVLLFVASSTRFGGVWEDPHETPMSSLTFLGRFASPGKVQLSTRFLLEAISFSYLMSLGL
uniref:Uncharacterized protein n=1 Tax=Molossus molossus TaxID=27622 RepID=A0A7J8J7N7_MOLMO|nr:hypothetical protein HJG59_009662 [Molossus molossus]